MSPAMSKADVPVGPTGWIIGTADSIINKSTVPGDTNNRRCLVAVEHVFRRPARAGMGQRNRPPCAHLPGGGVFRDDPAHPVVGADCVQAADRRVGVDVRGHDPADEDNVIAGGQF